MLSVVANADQAPHFTGGFAEYYFVRRGQRMFKVPEALAPGLAAGCNCALSQVLCGLRRAGVNYGDQVVIQGAGGLGLYATALAKEMGAGRVIVLDAVAERLELARAFGADEVIDVSEVTDPRERTSQVSSWTDGGADLAIEVVGRAEVLKEGVRMLARGGRYLVMGAIVPRDGVKLDPSILVGSNLSLFGVSLYEAQDLLHAVQFVERNQDRLPFERMFGARFRLEDVNEALVAADALGRGGSTAARIQLEMGS